MVMVMKNTTIVTALFDIGRDKWEHYRLPQEMYLGWYKNTLSLDADHIIYTDEVFYDRVMNILKEHGTSKNVMVIKKTLQELPAYKLYYDKMKTVMESQQFVRKISFNVPEMVQPLYNVIMFNKMFFVKDAIELNPFGSENFIWADAGGLREDIRNYKGVVWPSQEKFDKLDKDKILMFSHHQNISILVRRDHAMSQMRYIQGTSFFLTKNSIDRLITLFDKTTFDCLNKGYIGSDEKIFDFCYLDDPDLFQLEVSTWREYYDRYK